LIFKTIFSHIIYDIAAFFFFTTRGQSKYFIKAKWDALKGLNKVLKKRRQIQDNRKVGNDYIWGLMAKEHFFQGSIETSFRG
jgi:hypothetical protein